MIQQMDYIINGLYIISSKIKSLQTIRKYLYFEEKT